MSEKMNLRCLCGCEGHLTGKQRKFSTDACRKRYSRTGQSSQDVRKLPKKEQTVKWEVDISPFADEVKSGNSGSFLHLVECLQADLDYQEVWVKRLLGHPGAQLEKHQFAVAALTALIDSLVGAMSG